ncbi:60S ribosomal protein L4 [Tanacetum coccineum]
MKASIRPDIVDFFHSNVSKNSRQPYDVSRKAGHQTSADSRGTGRVVSRKPRVYSGGTHRLVRVLWVTLRGDGIANPKRQCQDFQDDGVRDLATASERSQLKKALEESTW